ncbi:hypothetical protein XELAEV_18035532mg [Xenopus laevis]|uniref:Uncharacterized protein n=1 Tax=Xenopus laevis TaxID=8355 RepID=A0A974CGF5_XENLA|nr:hypothetical protein XELAEV_18035532mg [Xenopus laevis]
MGPGSFEWRFTRVKRIVSDGSALEIRLDEMQKKFEERGYPTGLLEKQRDEVQQNMKKAKKSQIQRIPFVSRYSTVSTYVEKAIRKHWPLLREGLPDIDSFKNVPLISYKKSKSIGSMAVRSDVGGRGAQERLLRPRKNGTYLVMGEFIRQARICGKFARFAASE